ncbi:MAG: hypothetical protein K2P51_01280 [Rhabdochlamydiaceae bacterium]|nr:hypothetical protein [Rhabdochlamydiaceae bacterium]
MSIDSNNYNIFSCLPPIPPSLEESIPPSLEVSFPVSDDSVLVVIQREKRIEPSEALPSSSSSSEEPSIKLQRTMKETHQVYCELFNTDEIPELAEKESLPLLSKPRKAAFGSFSKDLRQVLFLDKVLSLYEEAIEDPSSYADVNIKDVEDCKKIQENNLILSAKSILGACAFPS